MADKTADAFKFNLRLPKPLHKRLLRDAQKARNSLNEQIVQELSDLHPRISESLREQIERQAKEHNVSLSAEIASRLEWSLRRDAEEDHTNRMVSRILAGLPAIRDMEADLAKMRQELGLPPRQITPPPPGGILGDVGRPRQEKPEAKAGVIEDKGPSD